MLGTLGRPTQEPSPDSPKTNSKLTLLAELWEQKRKGGNLPAKSDFPPATLKPWLANVGLVDVVGDPARFRIRLVGTNLVRYAGADFTGHWLDECVEPQYLDATLEPYRQCVERRAPVYNNTIYVHPGASRVFLQRLYLPCASDGQTIDVILVGIYAIEEQGHFYGQSPAPKKPN